MVLTTIYITRHGFRLNWSVDPSTGTYSSTHASPTNIPSDPPLAAHGVDQAKQLATYLTSLSDPPVITSIYSSPFYRCLQTLEPFVKTRPPGAREVKGDNGLGEWYGHARFTHPSPATPELLHELFPFYDEGYKPSIIPSKQGETIDELHQRCAYALHTIVAQEDAAGEGTEASGDAKKEHAMLICTHAASMIAMARALTGKMPDDISDDDFKTYTCGVSKFVRRHTGNRSKDTAQVKQWAPGEAIPEVDWQGSKGVGGGWDCVMNSNCEFLADGEERGWSFKEAETFY